MLDIKEYRRKRAEKQKFIRRLTSSAADPELHDRLQEIRLEQKYGTSRDWRISEMQKDLDKN